MGGEIRIGTDGEARLRRPVATALERQEFVFAGNLRRLDMIKVGNYETPSRGYVGRFNFKGCTSSSS
jgi:sulfate-transporting ATPase